MGLPGDPHPGLRQPAAVPHLRIRYIGDKDAEEAAADMQAACTEELLKQFPELVG